MSPGLSNPVVRSISSCFATVLSLCGTAAAGCSAGDEISCPTEQVASGGVCIDATEVTNEAFVAFLAEMGNDCQGHDCAFVGEPGSRLLVDQGSYAVQQGYESHPVVQVTWYGARDYCAAQGLRLCSRDEWTSACGGNAQHPYPYGDSYRETACNGSDLGEGEPLEVAGLADCQGASPGLFDMSGNVYEWLSTCADGPCEIRGGSFDRGADDLSCEAFHTMDGPSGHREDLGLRCCSE
ncbi:MAG: SUMF1/EgtB/PvdO family nonheme iron enzyme [Polyangia bacterium]